MSQSKNLLQELTALLVTNDHYSTESTATENEIEIYVFKPDLELVTKSFISKEYQEQYGLFVPQDKHRSVASSHRVRYSIKYDSNGEDVETKYEYTMKVRQEDGTSSETNLVADRDMFNRFKLASDNGMQKTRYNVSAKLNEEQGAVFEIDVFPQTPWVKIDLELPEDVDITDEEIITNLKTYISTYEDLVIVRPADKAANSPAAKKCKEIMNKHAILIGPFTVEE